MFQSSSYMSFKDNPPSGDHKYSGGISSVISSHLLMFAVSSMVWPISATLLMQSLRAASWLPSVSSRWCSRRTTRNAIRFHRRMNYRTAAALSDPLAGPSFDFNLSSCQIHKRGSVGKHIRREYSSVRRNFSRQATSHGDVDYWKH